MSAGPGGFAVILERESPRPHVEIGRLLAYHLELHPTDAIVRVRYGGGLIVDDVAEDTADHLVLRLRDIGVRARKIETALWALVPRGRRAFGLELGERRLAVRLVGGRKVEIPKGEIFGLHLYALEQEAEARQRGPDARAARPGPLDEAVLSPRGRRLLENLEEAGAAGAGLHLAILCLAEGPVRVRKNDFDFACLGAQRQDHSLDNFLILLEDVLAYVPGAWNREAAERFLEDLDPRKVLYFKEEEAENLERWLYQWARLEAVGQGGRGGEPSARPGGPADGPGEAGKETS